MAAKRKRGSASRAAGPYPLYPNPYDNLVNGIASLFAPILQEGLRRGVGLALANTGQVANGALLAQPESGAQNLYQEYMNTPSPQASGKCKVADCPNPVRCKGLCSKHYQVARRKAVKRGGTRRKLARRAKHPRVFDRRMDTPVRGPRRPARKAKRIPNPTSRKTPRASRPGKTAPKAAAPEPKAAA